jgi:REP element-mobilizing transposase RayT
MRYLITFACYGAHMHGDEAGSVDRRHHLFGGRRVETDPRRAFNERRSMVQEPYGMDCRARAAVLATFQEVCSYRGWGLLAAHVRATHVHVVVEAEARPERVMNDLKAYASRKLNRLSGDVGARRHWAYHGSTLWLWKDQEVRNAVRYVVEEQGQPMAVYVGDVP